MLSHFFIGPLEMSLKIYDFSDISEIVYTILAIEIKYIIYNLNILMANLEKLKLKVENILETIFKVRQQTSLVDLSQSY